MNIAACGLACAMSVLVVTASLAFSAEHLPGTASSRPISKVSVTARKSPAPLLYAVGTDARHANKSGR